MTVLLEPNRPRQIRFSGLRSITLFALIFSTFVASAQVFPSPSASYGIWPRRGVFDSTLYQPTGCGVPTDSTFLFSRGFGHGQILSLFSTYYDSCGHGLYGWDPSLKSWHRIDSSGGGSTDTSHLSARINLKLDILDSISNDPHAYTTQSSRQKLSDSLQAIMNVALALKKNLSDSLATSPGAYTTQASRQKLSDSLQALLQAGLLLKKNANDSLATSPGGFVTQASRQKAIDSLVALIASKITNAGGVSFLGYGLYSAKPTSGTGIWYASDSAAFFRINGATATNMTPVFTLHLVQGLTPYGTTGDSAGIGGIGFYQPDTLNTNGFPFLIIGLPEKATAAGTDSVLIEDITGKLYKLPVPSGGGGGSDSGFAVQVGPNTTAVPLQKYVVGTARFIRADTSHTNPAAIVTQAWRQALSDSLQAIIASFTSKKAFFVTGTQSGAVALTYTTPGINPVDTNYVTKAIQIDCPAGDCIVDTTSSNDSAAVFHLKMAVPRVTITSGSSSTIPDYAMTVYIEPTTTLSSYTLTTPINAPGGGHIRIFFGTAASFSVNATVVTSFTLVANTGQVIYRSGSTSTQQLFPSSIDIDYEPSISAWRIQ